MKKYYCNGKKDICNKGDDDKVKCGDCEHFNGEGGKVVEIDPTESEDTE